jgi:hypothetical protein
VRLAEEVVKQAVWDASSPTWRTDVRASIRSGALETWLLAAGVAPERVPAALAAIEALARRASGVGRRASEE